MLSDKLQDIFKAIEKSYNHEESQVAVLLEELDKMRGLVSELGEHAIVAEIESWGDSDSFELYWLYMAGFKSVSAQLKPYLRAKDLTQQLYATIPLAAENQQDAISRLEALKANNDANIDVFGFNGVKDENDLFHKIKEKNVG